MVANRFAVQPYRNSLSRKHSKYHKTDKSLKNLALLPFCDHFGAVFY